MENAFTQLKMSQNNNHNLRILADQNRGLSLTNKRQSGYTSFDARACSTTRNFSMFTSPIKTPIMSCNFLTYEDIFSSTKQSNKHTKLVPLLSTLKPPTIAKKKKGSTGINDVLPATKILKCIQFITVSRPSIFHSPLRMRKTSSQYIPHISNKVHDSLFLKTFYQVRNSFKLAPNPTLIPCNKTAYRKLFAYKGSRATKT